MHRHDFLCPNVFEIELSFCFWYNKKEGSILNIIF